MSVVFTGLIKIRGINPYVDVTAAQAKMLRPNWRKPLPVLVQVNGKPDQPWPINMMPTGTGDFYLYLHQKVRTASHTKVGDTVTISLEFNTTYQNGPQHVMPVWLQEALDANETAYKNWKLLPPSRKKEVLRYLAGLKSDTAKTRNLEKLIYVLSGKAGRFMARDWVNGR